MKAVFVILLIVVLQVALFGQTTTGKAATSGICSPATTGSNNMYFIKCDGVGEAQGKKIISLLNRVLANQDLTAVNAKLDELLELASKPVQTQNCVGSNCVQGPNYGPMTLNQYGAPKLLMTDDQRDQIRDAMTPFAGMVVRIICNDATEDSMAYANQLSKALNDAGLKVGQPDSAMAFSSPGTVIPSGVVITIGDDARAAATALGLAMLSSGLISKPIPATRNANDNAGFEIMITPNR